jgi:hypothetical protein
MVSSRGAFAPLPSGRSPRWLLIFVGLLAYTVVLLVIAYVWWVVAALAAFVAWKLARGFVRGWREWRSTS